ncbi:MAG: PAS domain S-box protein [Deltaproteobacteria bacterium]|nr:PAS domain S-box protein [Deltaproteobacteria bacterium]
MFFGFGLGLGIDERAGPSARGFCTPIQVEQDEQMSPIDRSTAARIMAVSGAAGLLVGARGEVLWVEDPAGLLGGQVDPLLGLPLADLFTIQGAESMWELIAHTLEGHGAGPMTVIPAGFLLSLAAAGRAPSFLMRLVPAWPQEAEAQVLALLQAQEARPTTPAPGRNARPSTAEADEAAKLPVFWYRQLLDLLPDGVAIINEEGRITFVNLCAANQFGYRVDELLGRWVVDLVAPEDRLHALPALLRTGVQPEGPVIFRILRADGALAVAELHGQLAFDEEGRRTTITMVRDISREARLQERTRARMVEEAIATFAGGMAHELGKLLDEIEYSLRLPAGAGHAGLRPLVERVAMHLEHGREIAARLQAIGGLQPHLDHHPLPLNDIVAEADRELKRSLGPQVLLRTAPSRDAPIVLGAGERLKRAVLQLSLNAQQAMPLGGHLLLRTDSVLVDDDLLQGIPEARPGCFAMLTVQDDGVGIDPEILDRIFTPYFTTHGGARGSGLGLALVQAIVLEHRGFISVESQPGRGTRFRIYLPLHQPSLPDPAGRIKPSMHRRRGVETLLLVDDREGIRPSLQPLLSLAGYRVLVSNGPDEAADLLERYRELIDLAVVDLARPSSDVPPLIEALRACKPGVKVIVVADATERGPWAEAAGEGSLLVLEGMPGGPQLQQAVRQLLDR